MRREEANWIAAVLAQLPTQEIAPALHLGSSTREFREKRQPHIQAELFGPLEARGVRVWHSDLKDGDGVDIVGDLLDPKVQGSLRSLEVRLLVMANLLEHVADPGALARAAVSLVVPGGLIVATVPRSYPYHADPIDTGFRPTPEELAALYPGCRLLRAETVGSTSYRDDFLVDLARLGWRRGLAIPVLRALVPYRGLRIWVGSVHRLMWLHRPFTTACVLLRRDWD